MTPRAGTTPTRPLRWLVPALGVGALLVSGCTAGSSGTDAFRDPALASGEFELVSFDTCDEAETQLRAAAAASVGPWGFGGMELFATDRAMEGDGGADRAEGPALAPAVPGQAEAAPPPVDQRAPDHSDTNVHESGVDEPDLVKTDGQRIVTVSQGVLRVVDPQRKLETGRLDLSPADQSPDQPGWWQPANLLLHGDHALVLFQQGWWGGAPVPVEPDRPAEDGNRPAEDGTGPAEDGTGIVPPESPTPLPGPRLLLVDLAGDPRVLSEYTVDGTLVDARAVAGVARVVVRSAPRIEFPQPRDGAGEAARLAANQEAVRTAELSDWLPRYQVTSAGRTATGQVDCTALSRPERYSGSSMLTVLSFDLAVRALGDGTPVSVVADGETVYSNGISLYVASDQRWRILPQGRTDGRELTEIDDRTELYKFDTSQPGPPRFAAAGSVPGWVINQYAMSEWDGHLRVATTSGETWVDQQPSESAVYVLAERDGKLVETGSVGGLGKTERIYSVRFTGPIGYVVTFRQTDPLYTLDLRDPAAPAVLGELKITGYSAYLHPLGDGRLIGVGQAADPDGRVQGTQVSLFDVSDLTDPTLVATHQVAGGRSEAEFDPHAFLWWPDQQLLVIPLVDWSAELGTESGALVLQLAGDRFAELATISHPAPPDPYQRSSEIRRSLVVGDTLWTVSDLGLRANALSTLEETGWVGF